jgi:hypothetical protein
VCYAGNGAMCSAEKFGAASGERRTSTIVPPISHHPTRNFSPNNRQFRSRFYQVVAPLLRGSAQNIECDVTYSKQSIRKFLPGATTTCSVAQFLAETRIASLARSPDPVLAEKFRPQNHISNRFWTKNRSYTKETIKPSLTGSRFALKVLQLRNEFRIPLHARCKKESASRDASEQGKIPLKAQKEKEPQ